MFAANRTRLRALLRRALPCAACALALTAPAASAGRYHVYSCRTPDGQAAPTDGWTPSTSSASATVAATDTCASGGALVASLGDSVPHEVGTYSRWALSIPSFDSMAALTFWRSGDTEGREAKNATYQFVFAGPTIYESFSEGECIYSLNCKAVGEPSEPLSMRNILVPPRANMGANFYVTASCGGLSGYMCPEGIGDPNGYAAVVYVYAADIVLEQSPPPSVTPGSVGGELDTASKVSGTASVTFEASDPGSGVYQGVVEVDGKEVGATVLNSNGGRCADVGQTSDGLPAFLYLKPCPATANGDVPLDTTSLSNGLHHVVVRVTDAAGNSAVVMDRKLEVDNAPASGGAGGTSGSSGGTGTSGGTTGGGTGTGGSTGTGAAGTGAAGTGAANGTPAAPQALLRARWQSSGKLAAVSRWGRAQTIVGTLTTAGGVPVGGASLEVRATPAAQGARASALATVRTRSNGAFTVRLPRNASSEQVVVAYRTHLGEPLPAAEQTLSLSVRASLRLRIAPRVSHAGGTIRFRGVLRGGHMPPGGKQLVLQARAPGSGWRTFQVLSTNRKGRYHASYRFRLAGPIRYRFRVLCRQEADFPFATGSSNVVPVWER